MIPKRFKIKVSQADYDSTKTPFWSERMIAVLLGFWRWFTILVGLFCALLASTGLGVAYFIILSALAFLLLRPHPAQLLGRLIEQLSRLWNRLDL